MSDVPAFILGAMVMGLILTLFVGLDGLKRDLRDSDIRAESRRLYPLGDLEGRDNFESGARWAKNFNGWNRKAEDEQP